MRRDLHNTIVAENALNVSSITTNTTTAGSIIDRSGSRALEFLIHSGPLTDGAYTPLIQHGDQPDLSDATAVDETDLLGTEAEAVFVPTDDNAVKKIGYAGIKRYVRLNIVSTGVTSGGSLSAIAVKGDLDLMPAA